MVLKTLNCPNCGGKLENEDELDSFFCKYCGYKIVLADMSDAAYKAKADIYEQKNMKKMKEMEYENDKQKWQREEISKEREHKRSIVSFILPLLAIFGIPAILYFFVFRFPKLKVEMHDRQYINQLTEYDYQIKEYVLENKYEEAESLNKKFPMIISQLEGFTSEWEEKYDENTVMIEEKKREYYGLEPEVITMTQGVENLINVNVYDVEEYLKKCGFLNVEKKGTQTYNVFIYGNTKSISIDGNDHFEPGDEFKDNVEVMIIYYGNYD